MNRLNKEGHIVEELGGVRCSIVEKNVSPERVEFLKTLLQANGYEVVVAPTPAPPPKPAPKPAPAATADGSAPVPAPPPAESAPAPPPPPATFTVGVTNITFHPMLAVYEKALFRPDGRPVSVSYWNQEPDKVEHYWENRIR